MANPTSLAERAGASLLPSPQHQNKNNTLIFQKKKK
jgi:hypothetical protein